MDWVNNLIEQFRQILFFPESIHSIGDYLVDLALLVPLTFLILWLNAFAIHSLTSERRKNLGTDVAVRLSWAWSANLIIAFVFLEIAILMWLGRLPDWLAVLPHATIALLAFLVAFAHIQTLRSQKRRMQTVLSAAR